MNLFQAIRAVSHFVLVYGNTAWDDAKTPSETRIHPNCCWCLSTQPAACQGNSTQWCGLFPSNLLALYYLHVCQALADGFASLPFQRFLHNYGVSVCQYAEVEEPHTSALGWEALAGGLFFCYYLQCVAGKFDLGFQCIWAIHNSLCSCILFCKQSFLL